MEGSDLLTAGVLFLFAAVAAVPLASRLGIGPVLGYLLAGIAIGPWGLGFISDVDEILHFSELGVVFLMFIFWRRRRAGDAERGGVGRIIDAHCVLLAGGSGWRHWSGDVIDRDGATVDA